MEQVLKSFSKIIFGLPLALIILFIGTYLTIKSRFFQIRKLKLIIRTVFAKPNDNTKGISPFSALTTSLAASIGTGNIVGVTAAIITGGPGAVFWMWVSGIFGMMTAFLENALAVKYRQKDKNGKNYGGAFLYLKNGIKNKKISAFLSTGFAFCCVLSSFTMGNMVQVSSASAAAKNLNINSSVFGAVVFFICLISTFKGIKSISKFTSIVVPVMSACYILIGFYIIAVNFNKIPSVIFSIFKSAFGFNSITGGFCGIALKNAITTGFKRGVFSNEAGLGSTTIAAACSSEENPKTQGLWGAFQVLFDTIVICSITALIVLLGTSNISNYNIDAVSLISLAFYNGFGEIGNLLLSIIIIMFALSTVIGWAYFGLSSAEFLFGPKIKTPFFIAYAIISFLGCNIAVNSCFLLADIFNGIMAAFNIIGLLIIIKQKQANNYL